MLLGGSIFVRNAIRFDYCVVESIRSLLPICDKVAVLDVESDDGTLELLQQQFGSEPKVEIHQGGKWEYATGYHRLAVLANQARELLNTRWHFMIQADEVLHQASYPAIYDCIAKHKADIVLCRRFNLYGGMGRMVRLDGHSRKPCGDLVWRLGRKEIPAIGDAECLATEGCTSLSMSDQIFLFHYGYVRDRTKLLDKGIEMTALFYGVDQRLVRMKEQGIPFQPYEIIPPEFTEPLTMSHPIAARGWVEARREQWEGGK